MNSQYDLAKYYITNTSFSFEAYVMSYLKALAEQSKSLSNHPLNTQLHLMPSQAYISLRESREVEKLANVLNCKKEEVFGRLRELIDEWDAVGITETSKAADLVESDAELLLLSKDALEIAAHYLRCSPENVFRTLFDVWQINEHLRRIPGGDRFISSNAQNIFRRLHEESKFSQKIKTYLDLTDWWEVLERWTKPSARAQLVSSLSQQTGRSISKAYALRELFQVLNNSIRLRKTQKKPVSRHLESTRLGMVLPEETPKFWSMLRDVTVDEASQIPLDALNPDHLIMHSSEANAQEALSIAEKYAQTYVQPIQRELGRVDTLGMIALKHRFQGIVDELLSNALHYASLENEAQNPLSYIQDAIRYYCHGEYRIALGNLLNVPFLSLEQMGVEYHVAKGNLNFGKDTPILLFSAEDNSSFSLSFGKPAIRPPRNVNKDELMIALRIANRTIEILSMNNLEKSQIEHIKAVFPKSIDGLVDNDYALVDRIIKTPILVSPVRQKINDALKEQIVFLVQSLVLSGTPLSLGHLIPSTEIFNKIPKPLLNDKTLSQTYSIEKLGQEIISAYTANGDQVTRIDGT